MCNAIANLCPRMCIYACMMRMCICTFASDTCATKRMLVHANCWSNSDQNCVTTERCHTNKWKWIITSQNFRPLQKRSDTPTMCSSIPSICKLVQQFHNLLARVAWFLRDLMIGAGWLAILVGDVAGVQWSFNCLMLLKLMLVFLAKKLDIGTSCTMWMP